MELKKSVYIGNLRVRTKKIKEGRKAFFFASGIWQKKSRFLKATVV